MVMSAPGLRGRGLLAALAVVATVGLVGGCGAAPGPVEETPRGSPTTSAAPTAPPGSPSPPGSVSPSSSAPADTPSADQTSPPAVDGLTLRQLGFENGPLDAFSLPRDLVIATRVDQPNVVTIVLAGPGPATVEKYLRNALPDAGFVIDARAADGQALTFEGHGWTGAFTGTGTTSAVVLRPA